MKLLFKPYRLGNIELINHIVMAPMTRSRAIGNIPNDLMAKYYGQRVSAGLIITEGTAPSANGLGYARIPGLYSNEQVAGWKKVTDVVHAKGGKIFVQLMHTGRISHPLNMPKDAVMLAPSAIAAAGMMYTDASAMQPHPTPKEMTAVDIRNAIEEYAKSAALAMEAGFDGVELHGANGYLLEQFLNPKSNQRKDEYGGSPENRARFVLHVAEATAKRIGAEKLGIRLSPYSGNGDLLPSYDGIDEFYGNIASKLSKLGLAYIHVMDHSGTGQPGTSPKAKELIRKNFKGTLILNNGFDAERAEAELEKGNADLIAFGRPFISNPDLPRKMQEGIPLLASDHNTFFTPGEKGYTDY